MAAQKVDWTRRILAAALLIALVLDSSPAAAQDPTLAGLQYSIELISNDLRSVIQNFSWC